MRNISHNIFYGYHPTGSLTGEPLDPFKITLDPLFVSPGAGNIGLASLSGYQLTSPSPAINSGRIINSNGGKDFWANTLYTASPDRGVHETAVAPLISSARQWSASLVDYKVFPNPAANIIWIQIPSQNDKYEISLHDISGKKLLKAEGVGTTSSLITDGLPFGIYLLKARTQSGLLIFSEKIIIRK